MKLVAWSLEPEGPHRLEPASVQLEADLEGWIEHDPFLVADGLRIVGRQVTLEGGRLDLLAVDPQGRLVLIEIKRGTLYRDVVVQALDYAASLSVMPVELLRTTVTPYLDKHGVQLGGHPVANLLSVDDAKAERRDVVVIIVGTGRDASLDRVVSFLGDTTAVPIRVVTFEVFDVSDGRRVLLREVTEADTGQAESLQGAGWSVESVLARAETAGVGEPFRLIYEAALRNNLYPRPWKYSIMYTPPSNHSRTLLTAWVQEEAAKLYVYTSAEAFNEFFPVGVETARGILGPQDQIITSADDARSLGQALDQLFAAIGEATGHDTSVAKP